MTGTISPLQAASNRSNHSSISASWPTAGMSELLSSSMPMVPCTSLIRLPGRQHLRGAGP